MIEPSSSLSPFKAADLCYLRLKLTGFEVPVGWERVGTEEKPVMRSALKPQVAWVVPIDKDGKPIDGAPIYAVDPSLLIHPAVVKQDIKEVVEKTKEEAT